MKIIFYTTLFLIPLSGYTYSKCKNAFSRGKEHRAYESAEEYVQQIGVTSQSHFKKLRKEGKIPKDIPSHPETTYKGKGWVNWGVFLGTGRVATQEKEFREYKSAEEYAQRMGITSEEHYYELSSSGKLPKDMPSHPEKTYKGKGWVNWGVFLGTGRVATFNMQFRSLKKAMEYVRSKDIRSSPRYKKLHKKGKLPKDMPLHPNVVYEGQGWRGWKHFFGTVKMMTYTRARKYVIDELGISTIKELLEWLRSDKVPVNFPLEPHKFYSEWTSARDFLRIQDTDQLAYRESKTYIQSFFFRTKEEALKWLVSEERPDSVPVNPEEFYGRKWENWDEYLGLNRVNGTGLNGRDVSVESQQKEEEAVTELLDKVFNDSNSNREFLLEENEWNAEYESIGIP